MFTNLASLLLGVATSAEPEGAASAEVPDVHEGTRLSVLEAEDDWLLVEAEDCDTQRSALLASMAVAPLTPLSARSRSHSVSSLPCLEESW